jgi:hypothetical protein
MGAYNWVIAEVTCPACGVRAPVRCQTHVASDYGANGDGRFHDVEYRLGERMRWCPEDDPDFPTWRVGGRRDGSDPSWDEEACYVTCEACHAALCVVIRFEQLVPVAAVHVSREADWPERYWK